MYIFSPNSPKNLMKYGLFHLYFIMRKLRPREVKLLAQGQQLIGAGPRFTTVLSCSPAQDLGSSLLCAPGKVSVSTHFLHVLTVLLGTF